MENKKDIHKFPYDWSFSGTSFTKDKGKVFSCFACGGGSTMGYKLAGFDVIGCNEIDERMNRLYVENNHPAYNYMCDIREMVNMDTLPEDLYSLDILDGSPPCSSFSIFGNREKDWGKSKKFREGQKEQVLDTLFFDFISLAKRLQPKVVVAENVEGILIGSASKYVNRIYNSFDDAGYTVSEFLLNGENMGVPQKRKRVFFICLRKDLVEQVSNIDMMFGKEPILNMDFKEKSITLGEVSDYTGKELKRGTSRYELWEKRTAGDNSLGEINHRLNGKWTHFSERLNHKENVSKTITSAIHTNVHYEQPRLYSDSELIKISTFPSDYNFLDQSVCYVCGMSVPPVMMAHIASNIWEQWLSKIKK